MRYRVVTCFRLAAAGLTLLPYRAVAQSFSLFGNNSLVNETCVGAGFNCEARDENFFAQALGSIVFALLSLTGLIFTALILLGGYRWMLARGNEAEIDKAKATIRGAIIGLTVTLASYSVWLTISYFL